MSSFQERYRAEHAMNVSASADESGLERRQWPGVAGRISQARLKAGLTDTQVARRLNMTIDSYSDLEHHDDEAFTVASLDDLAALGRILNVEPRVLLLGPEAKASRKLSHSMTFQLDWRNGLHKAAGRRSSSLTQLVGISAVC
jgi:transcriptional regulator with XRE-family HTH domain